MRLTIFHKLFISLMLISMLMMVGMALLINNSFQNGLQSYLNQSEVEKIEILAERVSDYYSHRQGWQSVQDKPELWGQLLRNIGEHPRPSKNHPAQKNNNKEQGQEKEKEQEQEQEQDKKPSFNQLAARLNLLDESGKSIIGNPKNLRRLHRNIQITKVPVIKNNRTVGWLSVLQRESIKGRLAERFLRQQLDNFYWIAAWAALFSFIVAALLVRHFLKPLKNLHAAAKSLSNGNFDYQIDVRGKDELAELSLAFNLLTTTLKTQKHSREQWLSDISHELRTPIAVLLSEIEAIEDGIRKPEPKYIRSLHDQVMTLTRLVDDLYSLSLSDSGVLIDTSHKVDITNIINSIANQNEVRLADKQIAIQCLYDHSQNRLLHADAKSLAQLIGNLFENSYRYTNPVGQIHINLQQAHDAVLLTIEDSAPGVPDEALPKLFDRLYRVDQSRSRANGGSGLGLSICENIVKMHNGHISAQHSALGGLKITISLPIKDN